ncbi:MAG: ion channel [Phycisphaerales bacterium]
MFTKIISAPLVPVKWIFVRPFWFLSDYGLLTWRIILLFFVLALAFANIYYYWGRLAEPGIVENLFVDQKGVNVQEWLVPLRALYFSVVTQTTLGFGDMYAKAQSFWGHILLGVQVILGYVLLGALVTRFAVLFTSGGPAGKFTPMSKEIKKLLKKLDEEKKTSKNNKS